METPNNKTYAIDIVKNYLPAIVLIGGGFVALVLAWKDIGDNKTDIKLLKEQIIKQYSIQREREDKTDKEIETILDYIEFEKGYQQAQKDLKK